MVSSKKAVLHVQHEGMDVGEDGECGLGEGDLASTIF